HVIALMVLLAGFAAARGAENPSPVRQCAQGVLDRIGLPRSVQLRVFDDSAKDAPPELVNQKGKLGEEGFAIYAGASGPIWIAADHEQGLTYGCDELSDRMRDGESLAGSLSIVQVP